MKLLNLVQEIKVYHCDGGSFTEPPTYKFHDAYFTVCDEEGKVIHFNKNIGDVWSGVAEYEAIKWAINNGHKPCIITSDCLTAISWAKRGARTKKHKLPKLDLTQVVLKYQHNNLADQWNARHHSPKKDRQYYIDRNKVTYEG